MADSYWQGIHWFLYFLNDTRARFGLPRLNLSYELCNDCQKHNEWMAQIGGLSHSSIGGFSENIAALGYKPEPQWAAKDFLRIWFDCPYHREILLQRDSYWAGLAFYYTDNGIYATFRICR